MNRIVTLITDFRTSDGYMGAVYGVLKSINPAIDILAITSDIPRGDIYKASRTLANCYKFYPAGTIHLVIVDPTVGLNRRSMIIYDNRYYFVGPDNGVFTQVMTESNKFKCYHITNDKYRLTSESETFHGRDLFAPAAAYISLGVPLDEFGPVIDNPVRLENPLPEINGAEINGVIVDIDSFGNLVTNIPAKLVKDNSSIIICGKKINNIKKSYSDVEEKQLLAYTGSSGKLEIAINEGSASDLLRISLFEKIKVTNNND